MEASGKWNEVVKFSFGINFLFYIFAIIFTEAARGNGKIDQPGLSCRDNFW